MLSQHDINDLLLYCDCVHSRSVPLYSGTHISEWPYRKRQGSIEMSINRKIALNSATAAWYIGHHAGLRRVRSRFNAALGFDFVHLCLFRDAFSVRVVVIK